MGSLGKLGKIGSIGLSSNGGVAQIATASGSAFPVWNTMQGNQVKHLSIFGRSEQNGVPSPSAPVTINSAGEEGLLLTIADKQDYSGLKQSVDIADALKKAGHDGILRSVGDYYDEIVYSEGKWALIQRIQNEQITVCTGVSNHVGDTDCYFNVKKVPVNGSILNGLLCTHFVQGNAGVNTINIRSNPPYLGIFRYPNDGATLTKDNINKWLSDNEVYVSYQLATPIEYNLDLPVISTYNGQTYFLTNSATIKLYMEAECKVIKAEQYIKDGLISWVKPDKNNSSANRNILTDLSGNDNNFTLVNFAFTGNSGYNKGYIQLDGVDDKIELLKTSLAVGTVQLTVSEAYKVNANAYIASMYDSVNKQAVGATISDGNSIGRNSFSTIQYPTIGTSSIPVHPVMFCSSTMDVVTSNYVTYGTYSSVPTGYNTKIRFHEGLVYNKKLIQSEIDNNIKVSMQTNGISADGPSILKL